MPQVATPPPAMAAGPQQPPKVAYVSFSAEIVPATTESLIASMANLVNNGIPEVHLLISTPGGSVMNGMNLYNVLRGLPIKLITHNVGNVYSICNAVFLAGEERYACPHSTFMFHGVGFDMPQNARLEEKLLRERLDGVLADQKRIASVIEERTKLLASDIAPLFTEAQTKDSAFAVSSGIVHAVKDIEIPAGAPVVTLVFNR